MRVRRIDPSRNRDLAAALLSIQRAAYQVEAALIGDDRIPQLREDLAGLRAAPLFWLGAFDPANRLVGGLAWSQDTDQFNLHRLVVDPAAHRLGAGRALVTSVLSMAGPRRTIVSTGRDNLPARALYVLLGFEPAGEVEVAPGLRMVNFVHVPQARG